MQKFLPQTLCLPNLAQPAVLRLRLMKCMNMQHASQKWSKQQLESVPLVASYPMVCHISLLKMATRHGRVDKHIQQDFSSRDSNLSERDGFCQSGLYHSYPKATEALIHKALNRCRNSGNTKTSVSASYPVHSACWPYGQCYDNRSTPKPSCFPQQAKAA